MPQTPDWKHALDVGMQFTEMRRSQARRIASDLVARGELARDQAAGAVEEILDLSRRRSEELRTVVRTEVQRQLGALGLATQDDLARLERRLARAAKQPAEKSAKKATKPSAKKATKTAKAPAKKAAAKTTKKTAKTAKRSGGAG